MDTVSLLDSSNIIVGDYVSFPLRRKWWQFWKSRYRTMRVVSVTSNMLTIE